MYRLCNIFKIREKSSTANLAVQFPFLRSVPIFSHFVLFQKMFSKAKKVTNKNVEGMANVRDFIVSKAFNKIKDICPLNQCFCNSDDVKHTESIAFLVKTEVPNCFNFIISGPLKK